MSLDLQAILNEAVSEVLGKEEDVKKQAINEGDASPGPDYVDKSDFQADDEAKANMAKSVTQDDEQKQNLLKSAKKAVEDHPYASAATGAIAAGLGALGLRKMIKKRGGVKK